MERFMLFEYDDYSACGGMDDFVQDFAHLGDAIERIKTCQAQLVSIYDNIAMKYVIHRQFINKIDFVKLSKEPEQFIREILKQAGYEEPPGFVVDIRGKYDNWACGTKPKPIEKIREETKNFNKEG
jgi:hypothetical protein